MLVFNVVVALFGAYMIWSALQMKKSGKINSMVLAQEELKKVKDTKGFIEFVYSYISCMEEIFVLAGDVVWCAGIDCWGSWSLK